MSDIVIITLMSLPLAGVLLANILTQFRRTTGLAWMPPAVAAGLTLLMAWVARGLPFELTFGYWEPVSVVGMPIILSGSLPGMSMVIAVAAAQFVTTLRTDERELRPHHTLSAVLFGALTITALSNSLTALIIGLGLVDILTIATGAARGRDYRQVITDAMFNGASSALLVIAMVLYAAAGNSLYFPLADIPDRLMGFISVALVLRLGLAPLRATAGQFHGTHWTELAGTVASFIIVIKIQTLLSPEFRAWVFALAVLTGLLSMAMGAISTRRFNLAAAANAGMLSLVVISALLMQSGIIAASVAAWLLGITCLAQPERGESVIGRNTVLVGQAIGAVCLIGVPFTAGFIARAGIAATWAGRNVAGATLIVGYAAVQMLLTICALRLLSDIAIPKRPPAPSAEPGRFRVPAWITTALGVAVLAFHALVFGLAPDLAGAPPLTFAIGRMGLTGWLTWLAATMLGVIAWWYRARWLPEFAPIGRRIQDTLGLGWLHSILDGAMLRIGHPLSRVSIILESGAGLMFIVIILLIITLVSRPGGP